MSRTATLNVRKHLFL